MPISPISSNAKGTIACAKRAARLPSATAIADRQRALHERLSTLGDAPFTAAQRRAFLDTFFATRSGREKPGRFWRIDFETLQPTDAQLEASNATIEVE